MTTSKSEMMCMQDELGCLEGTDFNRYSEIATIGIACLLSLLIILVFRQKCMNSKCYNEIEQLKTLPEYQKLQEEIEKIEILDTLAENVSFKVTDSEEHRKSL